MTSAEALLSAADDSSLKLVFSLGAHFKPHRIAVITQS